MDTIQDLLPNEHFLNFSASVKLPDWFGTGPKSLIMGAGDLIHGGMLNVQAFDMFDVYFCKPWDWQGSLRANMLYLLEHFNQQKLLCFIDIDNSEQMARFTELFAGRFQLIDGHMGHCPHFSIVQLHKLLADHGKAVNVFEQSETCLSVEDLDSWLNTGQLKKFRSIILTGRVHHNGSLTLPSDLEANLKQRCILKINSMPRDFVKLDASVQDDLTNRSLHQLQQIMYTLTLDASMPSTLVGIVGPYKRVWRTESYDEFVVTKRPLVYREQDVAAYFAANGNNNVIIRINAIKAGIYADADRDFVWGSQAKFNTLKKYIDTNIV